MSLEGNKVIVHRFIEAYNARNLEVFEELVAADYVDHTHQQRGRDNLKHLFTLAFQVFPDWHEQIEDLIAEKDMVWVCVKATGTHTGEWSLFGVPFLPTGKKVIMRMVFLWRIVDGRLSEGWEVDDELDFFKQLGIIEYTEKGKKLFSADAHEKN